MIRHPPRSPLFPYPPLFRSGATPQAEELWVRGEARAGTTRFYRIATAYVMLAGVRVTLAVQFVLPDAATVTRSEEHTSELQSRQYIVCRLLLEKKKTSNTLV